MNKYRLLSAAIATTLASASSFAAVINFDLKSPTALTFASENPANTTLVKTDQKFALKMPIPAYIANASNPFFVKIKLTGSATFSSDGNWTMKCAANSGAGANFFAAGSLQVGVNTDNATFNLPIPAGKNYTLQVNTGCMISGSQFGLNSGLKNVNFSAVAEYLDGSVVRSLPAVGSLITFANGLTVKYDRSMANVVVDVAAGSKEFTEAGDLGTVTKVSKATALLGKLTYDKVSTTVRRADTATTPITVTAVLNTLKIQLQGPSLGAVSTTGGVFLSKSAACGNSNALGTAQRASGSTVTFNMGIATAKTHITAGKGIFFCLHNKGANVVPTGTITATLTGTGTSSYVPIFGEPGSLADITKNGATTKVLNVPSPTNTVDEAFIRINNMSNRAGKVFGTLYSEQGQVIGNANIVIADLTAMQATAVSSTQLATLLGASSWEKRAWLQIDSELSSISVQNLLRNRAADVLLNASDSVKAIK